MVVEDLRTAFWNGIPERHRRVLEWGCGCWNGAGMVLQVVGMVLPGSLYGNVERWTKCLERHGNCTGMDTAPCCDI